MPTSPQVDRVMLPSAQRVTISRVACSHAAWSIRPVTRSGWSCIPIVLASLYCCCIRDKRDCTGRKGGSANSPSPEGEGIEPLSPHPKIARRVERQRWFGDSRDPAQRTEERREGKECVSTG